MHRVLRLLLLGAAVPSFAATFVPAASPLISWSGRWAVADAAAGSVAFDMESTACAFSVVSPGPNATNVWLDVTLALPSPTRVGRLSVFMNDYDSQNLMITQGAGRYLVGANLLPAPARNNVTVMYTMEPVDSGADAVTRNTPVFLGFTVEGPGAIVASAPLARRIDVLGDSITAGSMYDHLEAVNGPLSLGTGCGPWSPPSGYSSGYNWQTYLCRFFRANCTTVAWSGGVLVDPAALPSGCATRQHIPQLYRQVFATDATSVWDFAAASRPDAVIVYLGTNDFGCGVSDALFTATAVQLVHNITAYYAASPGAAAATHFFLAIGPMSPTRPVGALEAALAQVTAAGVSASLLNMTSATLDGCGGHPGPAGHLEMALQARDQVRAAMGW